MCIAAMKTMTAAQRAKRIAQNAKISCEIVSLDSNMTKNGCAYGVAYPCYMNERFISLLYENGVSHGDILGI